MLGGSRQTCDDDDEELLLDVANGDTPSSPRRQQSYHNFTTRDLTSGLLSSSHSQPALGRSISQSSISSVHSFSFRGISHQQRLVLISLALLDFFCFMCLSLPAPFFPAEAEARGISGMISGWIFGVFSLTQFLISPVFGRLLLHVEGRFLCISGMFLAGGCTVLFGMLDYMPFDENEDVLILIVYCFVLRIFLSIGCTATTTSSFAITADTFPDNVGAVFGILETFTGLGLMVGPALGGVLYDYLGFMGPFTVLGGIMVGCVPLVMIILPRQDAGITVQSQGMFWKLLRVPPAVLTLVSVIFSAVIWSLLDPTLEPHLRQFDLTTAVVGLIFLLMSAFYAISSPIWGWVADKVRDSSILIVLGFFGSAAGLLLLGPSPIIPFIAGYDELWLNLVALVVLGMSVSLAMIPTFEKVLDAAEKAGLEDSINLYSVVAGLWGSANALGEFIGPSLGGMAVDKFGFDWTVTVVAGACGGMGIIIFCLWVCEKYTSCCTSEYERSQNTEINEDEAKMEESESGEHAHYYDAADPDLVPVNV